MLVAGGKDILVKDIRMRLILHSLGHLDSKFGNHIMNIGYNRI